MSVVMDKVYPDRKLAHLVKDCTKYYYVDSCYTFDHGLETMVFLADENGKVLSWDDLYVEHHNSIDEMYKRHGQLINNLEKYI